jgi:hypothetical protein
MPPQVTLSDPTRAFIESHGGALYIWPSRHRCCGGALTLLDTDFAPPSRLTDWSDLDLAGLRVFLDTSVPGAQEISVLLHRWPRPHLTALWNGCAWVG